MSEQQTLTDKQQAEQQFTQSCAGKIRNLNSSEQVGMWELELSPLTIMRQNDEYYVILGKYRLSEAMQTIEQAYEDAIRTDLNRILQLIEVGYQLQQTLETIKNQ